jgi:hypothetical protein
LFDDTNRFRVSWTVFFIGVAFSVFLWGLRYKVSLYDPPQASSHQMPAAKLLTGKEQVATQGSVLIQGGEESRTSTVIGLASFSVLFALTFDLAAKLRLIPLRRAAEPLARLRLDASLSSHYFRPPPILF